MDALSLYNVAWDDESREVYVYCVRCAGDGIVRRLGSMANVALVAETAQQHHDEAHSSAGARMRNVTPAPTAIEAAPTREIVDG